MLNPSEITDLGNNPQLLLKVLVRPEVDGGL